MLTLAIVLLLAAVGGLAAIAAQHAILRAHVRQAPPVPSRSPPVSILKPLCGLDDGLEANLASFASLDHPDYEVLLGLRSADDPAFGIARWAARRWPRRFRVVLQRGEPGLNPKVNQLVTLARAARHDVLVVSDSNVRVERAYLSEIVAHLEDDGVGLVTHPSRASARRGSGRSWTTCTSPAPSRQASSARSGSWAATSSWASRWRSGAPTSSGSAGSRR